MSNISQSVKEDQSTNTKLILKSKQSNKPNFPKFRQILVPAKISPLVDINQVTKVNEVSCSKISTKMPEKKRSLVLSSDDENETPISKKQMKVKRVKVELKNLNQSEIDKILEKVPKNEIEPEEMNINSESDSGVDSKEEINSYKNKSILDEHSSLEDSDDDCLSSLKRKTEPKVEESTDDSENSNCGSMKGNEDKSENKEESCKESDNSTKQRQRQKKIKRKAPVKQNENQGLSSSSDDDDGNESSSDDDDDGNESSEKERKKCSIANKMHKGTKKVGSHPSKEELKVKTKMRKKVAPKFPEDVLSTSSNSSSEEIVKSQIRKETNYPKSRNKVVSSTSSSEDSDNQPLNTIKGKTKIDSEVKSKVMDFSNDSSSIQSKKKSTKESDKELDQFSCPLSSDKPVKHSRNDSPRSKNSSKINYKDFSSSKSESSHGSSSEASDQHLNSIKSSLLKSKKVPAGISSKQLDNMSTSSDESDHTHTRSKSPHSEISDKIENIHSSSLDKSSIGRKENKGKPKKVSTKKSLSTSSDSSSDEEMSDSKKVTKAKIKLENKKKSILKKSKSSDVEVKSVKEESSCDSSSDASLNSESEEPKQKGNVIEKSNDSDQPLHDDFKNKRKPGFVKGKGKEVSPKHHLSTTSNSSSSSSDEEASDSKKVSKIKVQLPKSGKPKTPKQPNVSNKKKFIPKTSKSSDFGVKSIKEKQSSDASSPKRPNVSNKKKTISKKKKSSDIKVKGVKEERSSDSSSDTSLSSESEEQKQEKQKQKGKVTRETKSSRQANDPLIRNKKYLRTMGIHVQYVKLFEGCKSIKSKKEKMLKLMKERGLKGKPTLDKCKKLRKKNETIKEIQELDLGNIISDSGRGRRNVDSLYSRNTSNISSQLCSPTKKAKSRITRPVSESDSDSD